MSLRLTRIPTWSYLIGAALCIGVATDSVGGQDRPVAMAAPTYPMVLPAPSSPAFSVSHSSTTGPSSASSSASASVSFPPGVGSATSQASPATLGRLDAAFIPAVVEYLLAIGSTNTHPGQSFTVQQSGWLTRVEVYIQSCLATPPDLTVEIRKGLRLTDPIVAKAVIPGTAIAPNTNPGCGSTATQAAFAVAALDLAPLPVQAGDVYSLWPSTVQPGAYAWAASGGYTEGFFMEQPATGDPIVYPHIDAGFRTYLGIASP